MRCWIAIAVAALAAGCTGLPAPSAPTPTAQFEMRTLAFDATVVVLQGQAYVWFHLPLEHESCLKVEVPAGWFPHRAEFRGDWTAQSPLAAEMVLAIADDRSQGALTFTNGTSPLASAFEWPDRSLPSWHRDGGALAVALWVPQRLVGPALAVEQEGHIQLRVSFLAAADARGEPRAVDCFRIDV